VYNDKNNRSCFIYRIRAPPGDVNVPFAVSPLRVPSVPLEDSKRSVNNILAQPVSRMNVMKV
jgi:hypothetical protein